MMGFDMRLLFNILAISGSATYAGVMLAIGVILGGFWKRLSAADFLDSFVATLPFIGRAISAVLLPTLAGLAGSLWLSWGARDAWTLWLSAVAWTAALLILTVIWFGPVNSVFAARSVPMEQVAAKRNAWLMLHNLRIALAAAASVLGVIAISR
jgi:hypothetical protein